MWDGCLWLNTRRRRKQWEDVWGKEAEEEWCAEGGGWEVVRQWRGRDEGSRPYLAARWHYWRSSLVEVGVKLVVGQRERRRSSVWRQRRRKKLRERSYSLTRPWSDWREQLKHTTETSLTSSENKLLFLDIVIFIFTFKFIHVFHNSMTKSSRRATKGTINLFYPSWETSKMRDCTD